MKKIFFFVTFLIFVFFAKAQNWGNTIPIGGNPTTLSTIRGGFMADIGSAITHYSDTTAANLTPLKNTPGATILTDDSIIFIRNFAVTKWFQIGGSGGGGITYTADRGVKIINTNLIRLVDTLNGAGTKFQWLYDKGAFRAITVSSNQSDVDSVGVYSFAGGVNTKAVGQSSVAFGDASLARGNYSLSLGISNKSIGSASLALGQGNTSYGDQSATIGQGNIASGTGSMSLGSGNNSSATAAFAGGFGTIASGTASTSFGAFTIASGGQAFASGTSSVASGSGATAMGTSTVASGNYSFASGNSSRAIGAYSTAMGNTVDGANGDYSMAVNQAFKADGVASFASGISTWAIGRGSTAMGTGSRSYGDYSSVIGGTGYANAFATTTVGLYNDTTVHGGSKTAPNDTNPIFVVGVGYSQNAMRDGFRVMQTGQFLAPAGYYINNNAEDSVFGLDFTTKALKMVAKGGGGTTYTFGNGITGYGNVLKWADTLIRGQVIKVFDDDLTFRSIHVSDGSYAENTIGSNGTINGIGKANGSSNLIQIGFDKTEIYCDDSLYLKNGTAGGGGGAAYNKTTTDTTDLDYLSINRNTGSILRTPPQTVYDVPPLEIYQSGDSTYQHINIPTLIDSINSYGSLSQWTTTGSDIANNNVGNVQVGINNVSRLTVDATGSMQYYSNDPYFNLDGNARRFQMGDYTFDWYGTYIDVNDDPSVKSINLHAGQTNIIGTDASFVTSTITGASGQSVDLFQIKDNAGDTMLRVKNGAGLTLGLYATGALLQANGSGAIAAGYQGGSSSAIQALDDGAFAIGVASADNCYIKSGAPGAMAKGYINPSSSNSHILANVSGSIASGTLLGASNSVIETNADGAATFAYLTADSTSIEANGGGSVANGWVGGIGSYIEANGDGAWAGGAIHNSHDSIATLGFGALAYGNDDSGSVIASGQASFALGSGVRVLADHSFALGVGFNNGSNNSFEVGYGSVNLHVEANKVGINTSTPDASSALEIKSNTQGFLPPRMTGTEAEAIASPAEGLMIYSTDGSGVTITSKGWWGWSGATWEKLN